MASKGSKRPRSEEPGPRRLAREAAVQVLYALDAANTWSDVDAATALARYWSHLENAPEGRDYCDVIVRGVATHHDALDAAIRAANPTWRVERMARVDRNVLRLGAWELIHGGDIGVEVVIDEAIELARRFGGEESPAFVNGTLDKVAKMQKTR